MVPILVTNVRLNSFTVSMKKFPDKGNLREKGFILTYIQFVSSSCPSWWTIRVFNSWSHHFYNQLQNMVNTFILVYSLLSPFYPVQDPLLKVNDNNFDVFPHQLM